MGKKRSAADLIASLEDDVTAERFDRVDELRDQLRGKKPTDAPGATSPASGNAAAPTETVAPVAPRAAKGKVAKALKAKNARQGRGTAAKPASAIASSKAGMKQPDLPLEPDDGERVKVTVYLNKSEMKLLEKINSDGYSRHAIPRPNNSHVLKALLAYSARMSPDQHLEVLKGIPFERTGPKASSK